MIFDPVGGDYSEAALRSDRLGGRFLVVGFPAGIAKLPLNLTLLKSCDVCGVFWGAFAAREPQRNAAHVEQLFRWWAEGKIAPKISATYPLERGGEAIARSATAALGKAGGDAVKIADWRGSGVARALFWAAAAFAFVMAVLPHPPNIPGNPNDKLQHIAAFATLALLGSFAFPCNGAPPTAAPPIAVRRVHRAGAGNPRTPPRLRPDGTGLADTAAVAVILLLVRWWRRS